MPREDAKDIRHRLMWLADDLSQGTYDAESHLIARDAVTEIEILRAEVAALGREIDAVVRLIWLEPVYCKDGSIWASGRWRAAYRQGTANTFEEAREAILDAAGEAMRPSPSKDA